MRDYKRCGKCRLYIDPERKSKLTRVCRCADTRPTPSVEFMVKALAKFDKRPLWQRALERREREKRESRIGRRRVVDLTLVQPPPPEPAPSAPRLTATIGDLARHRG